MADKKVLDQNAAFINLEPKANESVVFRWKDEPKIAIKIAYLEKS